MTESASISENAAAPGDQADQQVNQQQASTQEDDQCQGLFAVTLEGAIALAKDNNYPQATSQFEALTAQIELAQPEITPLLKMLWEEYLSAQRSATFWQSLSDAEKDLSEKMSESNIQLKQNYMRLIQEQ